MEWTRARLILIVLLAAVNLALAYQIWGPPARQPASMVAFTSRQIDEVRRRLWAMGIELAVPIPRTVPAVSMVRVLLPEAGDGLVERIEHAPLPDDEAPLGLDATAARLVAEQFLRRRPPPTAVRFERTLPLEGGRMAVEFVQIYQSLPVFGGSLTLVVAPTGVVELHRHLLEIGGPRGDDKVVLPPTEALLRLVGHLEARGWQGIGRSFTDIELGYHGDRPADARAWDMAPVWRIRTDNDEVYRINAFTGELEY